MGVYLDCAVGICWLPRLQVRAAVALDLVPALPLPLPLAPSPAPAPALVLAPDPLSCSEPEVGESHALRQRIFLVATVGRHGRVGRREG